MKKTVILTIVFTIFLAGCGSQSAAGTEVPPAYNILGEWEYTLIATDGNTYDNGTITFAGTSDQGSWTQLNFYEVEYAGTFTVNGDAIRLTGDVTWMGQITDASHMNGTWQNNEASGEWTAVKK
ncbi:MAG: hypothetical protein ACOYZ6_06285 [Chloroflexota bacterium]